MTRAGDWSANCNPWATGGAPTVACELQSARYDLVMKAFGGDGETVERPERGGSGDRSARSQSRVPYCLNVKIRGARSPFTEWQIAGKKKDCRAPQKGCFR